MNEKDWKAKVTAATREQCPDGYTMTIRDPDEWKAIAAAWNQGIDAHLEAVTERSTADAGTGNVNVHPDELHVLVRRLLAAGDEQGESLGRDILGSLDLDESMMDGPS